MQISLNHDGRFVFYNQFFSVLIPVSAQGAKWMADYLLDSQMAASTNHPPPFVTQHEIDVMVKK